MRQARESSATLAPELKELLLPPPLLLPWQLRVPPPPLLLQQCQRQRQYQRHRHRQRQLQRQQQQQQQQQQQTPLFVTTQAKLPRLRFTRTFDALVGFRVSNSSIF